jgi:hypothetical protein
MKQEINNFVRVITRKRTRDIFYNNVTNISRKDDHVVVYVDNAGPLHELNDAAHDAQIKKAVDQICGEECTYEVKMAKNNVIHERAAHVMRRKSPRAME